MARSIQLLSLFLIIDYLFIINPNIQDESVSDINGEPGHCRLWDVDITADSIIASPAKLQSSVGTIRFLPSLYVATHNQSCDKCAKSRYEICDANSSTCQCSSKTFWNGSICLVQLLRNQTCSRADACRADLNLTWQPSCDLTYRCAAPPAIGVGQTAAGFCNDSVGGGASGFQGPWSIYVSPSDGILYVADYGSRNFQVFSPFSRIGLTLFSTGLITPIDIFVASSDTVYMTDRSFSNGTVYVQRAGTNVSSFPTAGLSTSSCLVTGLYEAYGVASDRSGSIYVSMPACHIVVKWTPNATVGACIAEQPGVYGSTGATLSYVRFLHLDEDRGVIYISNTNNHRIQQFTIQINGKGVTVAGLNQLNQPGGIWVTRDGQTLYVADWQNHRAMKWTVGDSQGSVVIGSATGIAGNTSHLLNEPGDVALDPSETYLYVSDYGNHRIQRVRLR